MMDRERPSSAEGKIPEAGLPLLSAPGRSKQETLLRAPLDCTSRQNGAGGRQKNDTIQRVRHILLSDGVRLARTPA